MSRSKAVTPSAHDFLVDSVNAQINIVDSIIKSLDASGGNVNVDVEQITDKLNAMEVSNAAVIKRVQTVENMVQKKISEPDAQFEHDRKELMEFIKSSKNSFVTHNKSMSDSTSMSNNLQKFAISVQAKLSEAGVNADKEIEAQMKLNEKAFSACQAALLESSMDTWSNAGVRTAALQTYAYSVLSTLERLVGIYEANKMKGFAVQSRGVKRKAVGGSVSVLGMLPSSSSSASSASGVSVLAGASSSNVSSPNSASSASTVQGSNNLSLNDPRWRRPALSATDLIVTNSGSFAGNPVLATDQEVKDNASEDNAELTDEEKKQAADRLVALTARNAVEDDDEEDLLEDDEVTERVKLVEEAKSDVTKAQNPSLIYTMIIDILRNKHTPNSWLLYMAIAAGITNDDYDKYLSAFGLEEPAREIYAQFVDAQDNINVRFSTLPKTTLWQNNIRDLVALFRLLYPPYGNYYDNGAISGQQTNDNQAELEVVNSQSFRNMLNAIGGGLSGNIDLNKVLSLRIAKLRQFIQPPNA